MRIRTIVLTIAAASVAAAQTSSALPGAGNVALTLEEFNRLVGLAAKPPGPAATPQVDFAIQRAEMKFEVVAGQAFGTIQLEGEVFAPREVKVPLISSMTVFEARRQGPDLPLQLEGATHNAVVGGPGAFSIALEAGVPVAAETGRATLTLPVPAAGTVRLALIIPGEHTNVNLSPGLITARASNGGRTLIEATLTGGQTTTIWWATRETAAPAAAQREARFLADVKTLITVGESGIAVAALAEITVLQGEPAQFEIDLPAGYEFTGASGPTLEASETQSGKLVLRVNGAARNHQILISLERTASGSTAAIAPPDFVGAQRETGEVLVEGEGAVELTASGAGGLKRMDLKEANQYLRSMARHPVHTAFRYHRQPGETPSVAMEWVRFPDAGLIVAAAESAGATTLVTSAGRSLTEIRLTLRNREQPFLKVGLPAGASIVSAEVAGEAVKPVQGVDGIRVPLLRPGFRPAGPYVVSFVYVHSGAPFGKKGAAELALPKMDLPVGVLDWEVYIPQQFRARDFGGDVISSALLPRLPLREEMASNALAGRDFSLSAGQLGGTIVDRSGSAIPNVALTVVHLATGTTRKATTDPNGNWTLIGLPPGRIRITADASGFKRSVQDVEVETSQPARAGIVLEVGNVVESVEVRADSAQTGSRLDRPYKDVPAQASANVFNLQRRVAGVLPIHVEVPRTGNSYRFARPLVVDQETKLTFNYKLGR